MLWVPLYILTTVNVFTVLVSLLQQKPGVPKVELEFQPITSSELFHQLNHQLKQNLRQQKIQDQKRQPEKVKDFRERPASTKRKKSKGRPKPPGDAQGAATTQFDSAEAAFGDSFQEESSNGERIDFQMHGYNGPLSYKWGYDTGKG